MKDSLEFLAFKSVVSLLFIVEIRALNLNVGGIDSRLIQYKYNYCVYL